MLKCKCKDMLDGSLCMACDYDILNQSPERKSIEGRDRIIFFDYYGKRNSKTYGTDFLVLKPDGEPIHAYPMAENFSRLLLRELA